MFESLIEFGGGLLDRAESLGGLYTQYMQVEADTTTTKLKQVQATADKEKMMFVYIGLAIVGGLILLKARRKA